MNNYCKSELIIIIFFIVSNLLGILGFLRLIYLRCKISSVRIYTTEFTFSKFKLILLYIFGLGYMFHSGLYAWKHFDFQEECPGNSYFDFIYDISSILHTFFIFLYFALFHDRKLEQAVKKYYVLISIIVANLCIWFNAILFGSDFLYEKPPNSNSTSPMINITESSNIAVEAIEKADTFCLPAMVEFSLMAIDMLFTENGYTINGYSARKSRIIQETDKFEKVSNGNEINLTKICHCVKKAVQVVVSLAAFLHFAFVFTIVLTTHSTDNILDHSHYFLVYLCFELVMKLSMLTLILIWFCKFCKCAGLIRKCTHSFVVLVCTPCGYVCYHKCARLIRKCTPSLAVLVFTTCGNVSYHILYIVALSLDDRKYQPVPMTISLIVNGLSLLLAILQSFLIQVIRSNDFICTSSQENQQCSQTNFLYYTCFVLSVFNFALWASDSIGEDRRSILSVVYNWSYEQLGSSVIYTIFFPLTVFYRFQSGLDFLEFYWKN